MNSVHVLITPESISDAVRELGRKITEEYTGQDLTVIGILTGSIVLVTDLIRQISVPHELGLIQASSYRGTATSPGELHVNLDFLPTLTGKNLLVVDDIFDTGRTLSEICRRLREFNPASIQTAVLLWKSSRTEVESVPDYFCFDIPDEFVVGYGLDYNQQYRHLPFIGTLKKSEN